MAIYRSEVSSEDY